LGNFDEKDEKIEKVGNNDNGQQQEGKQLSLLFKNPLISEQDLKDPNGYQYDPEIINNITKSSQYSDHWFCYNCDIKDDKWGIMKHICKHNKMSSKRISES
jgi:hypothetical protein